MSAEKLSVETIRDELFINPKPEDIEILGRHMLAGFQEIQALHGTDVSGDSLVTIVDELVADYRKGARYFDEKSVAQLHPSGNIVAMLAHGLSTYTNNNTIVQEVSPLETKYEKSNIRWMNKNLAKYGKESSSGILTSGGTSANITALMIARTRLEEIGWDGQIPVTVFFNEMAHYSITKAVEVLFPNGKCITHSVPMQDGKLKQNTDWLAKEVKKHREKNLPILAIVGVPGETETGLVEDIERIAEIAHEYGVYFHADGAYGAPYILSKRAELFKGMSGADSITCDPHKYLWTPYNAGALLIKNATDHGLLKKLNAEGEAYMMGKKGSNLGDARIEGSMGGQAAATLYWTIKALKVSGFAKLLDHTIDVTEKFANHIEEEGIFRNVFEPELNTACIVPNSYDPVLLKVLEDGREREVEPNFDKAEAILAKEGIYISKTKLQVKDPDGGTSIKRHVLRFVATQPHTSTADAESIAETIGDVWRSVMLSNSKK